MHEPEAITVPAYLHTWASGKTALSIHTLKNYRSAIRNYLTPALAATLLTDIQPADIERLRADLSARPLSERTVKMAYSVLIDALDDARYAGLTAAEPVWWYLKVPGLSFPKASSSERFRAIFGKADRD